MIHDVRLRKESRYEITANQECALRSLRPHFIPFYILLRVRSSCFEINLISLAAPDSILYRFARKKIHSKNV